MGELRLVEEELLDKHADERLLDVKLLCDACELLVGAWGRAAVAGGDLDLRDLAAPEVELRAELRVLDLGLALEHVLDAERVEHHHELGLLGDGRVVEKRVDERERVHLRLDVAAREQLHDARVHRLPVCLGAVLGGAVHERKARVDVAHDKEQLDGLPAHARDGRRCDEREQLLHKVRVHHHHLQPAHVAHQHAQRVQPVRLRVPRRVHQQAEQRVHAVLLHKLLREARVLHLKPQLEQHLLQLLLLRVARRALGARQPADEQPHAPRRLHPVHQHRPVVHRLLQPPLLRPHVPLLLPVLQRVLLRPAHQRPGRRVQPQLLEQLRQHLARDPALRVVRQRQRHAPLLKLGPHNILRC